MIITKSNATKNFISLYDITKKVRDQETTANKVYCLAEFFLWSYGSKVSCFIFQNIAILVTRRISATLLLLVSNQGNDLVLVFGIRITVGDRVTTHQESGRKWEGNSFQMRFRRNRRNISVFDKEFEKEFYKEFWKELILAVITFNILF